MKIIDTYKSITDTSKVRISENDTTPSQLENKLLEGSGIILVKDNSGANETLSINVDTVLDLDQINFNTNLDNPSYNEGTVFYDNTKKALSYYNEEEDVTVNIGQEVLIRIHNGTGDLIPNGTVVYPSGVLDGCVLVGLANAGDKDKCRLIGVVTHDIANGEEGYVTKIGEVGGLDTTGYSSGEVIYLDTIDGQLTDVKPIGGAYITQIGAVKTIDAVNGSIVVDINTTEFTVEASQTLGWSTINPATLSFDDSERTLTISPTNSHIVFYQNGDKYSKLTDSYQIPDEEGLYLIYYNLGEMTHAKNPLPSEIADYIKSYPEVAYVYWNATDKQQEYLGFEMHRIGMNAYTHAYLHQVLGLRYLSGLAPNTISANGSGDLATDAQFGIDEGIIADEDLTFNVPPLSASSGLFIYYLNGTLTEPTLRGVSNPGFSVITTGTGRLAYNTLSGSDFVLAEVPNNDFVCCHVIAVNENDSTKRVFALVGQASYPTLSAARKGAQSELNNVRLLGMIPNEVKAIATFLFQTSNGYLNAVKGRIRTIDTDVYYVDWREVQLAGVAGTTTPTTFSDQLFTIYNSIDPSKIMQFEGSGITTDTTRTLTIPDADGTIALVETIDHNEILNVDLADTGITYGHIDDQSQVIAGIKGFVDVPISSGVPTTDYQVTNKKYITDNFQPVDADLTAISNLTSSGIAVRTGVDSWGLRNIEAGSGITVSNGDGISDNPTISSNDSEIDHNSLLNYETDRHIDHSSISITVESGLIGGGTIDEDITIALDVSQVDHNSFDNVDLADTGVTYGHIDDQAQNIYGAKRFIDDTTIEGNLTVNGSAIIVNTETVVAKDNLILINSGEVGSGVTKGIAGIQVDRGQASDYQFLFSEDSDTFRVGEEGSLQAVATREDNPINNAIAYWEDSSSRFVTIAEFLVSENFKGLSQLDVSTGFVVQIDADSFIKRTITSSSGITITDGDGVSSNPVIKTNDSEIVHNNTYGLNDGDYIHLTEAEKLLIDDTVEANTLAFERTGFPNKSDSTLSFNDSNLTFTLGLASGVVSFDIYQNDVKYTKTSSEDLIIDNTEGIHIIYYEDGVLKEAVNPSTSSAETIIRTLAIVCILYWDVSEQEAIYVGEERHGMQMSGSTHYYLHAFEGLRYLSGLGATDVIAGGSGDLNTSAQFGIASGGVTDEDLYVSVSAVLSAEGLPIYYMTGADANWNRYINTGYSVRTFDGTNTTRLAFNEFTGGAWQLTEITNGDFVLCHVFATTEKDNPIIAIMGQDDYLTTRQARTGALTEIQSLVTNDLLFPEIRPLYTFIFQTNNNYDNDVKGRIITTDDGNDYVDWRSETISRVSISTSDHTALSNLNSVNYWHLTQAQSVLATQSGSATQSGLINPVDWSNFNSKQDANAYLDTIDQVLATSGVPEFNSVQLNNGSGGYVKFDVADGSNSGLVLTYPVTDGSSGQVLVTNGEGNFTWGESGGGADGTNYDYTFTIQSGVLEYTIPYIINNKEDVEVAVNGIWLYPSDYSVSGNYFTFESGVVSYNDLILLKIHETLINTTAINPVNYSFVADSGSVYTLSFTPISKSALIITDNGAVLHPDDYSLYNTDVTFVSGVLTYGDEVVVYNTTSTKTLDGAFGRITDYSFTADSGLSYTLPYTPVSKSSILAVLEGGIISPDDYTLSTNILTFGSGTIQEDDDILVKIIDPVITVADFEDAPNDGQAYVRVNQSWVLLSTYL